MPADTYVCSPEECVEAPYLLPPEYWGEPGVSTDIGKFNVSPGYFNLNPERFGLTYDIFQFPLGFEPKPKDKEKRQSIGLPVLPGQCYDDCNNAMLEAESEGKTSRLCRAGSAFMEALQNCFDCANAFAEEGDTSRDDFPEFAQFLDFCDDQDSDPTSSADESTTSTTTTSTTSSSRSTETTSSTTQSSQTTSSESFVTATSTGGSESSQSASQTTGTATPTDSSGGGGGSGGSESLSPTESTAAPPAPGDDVEFFPGAGVGLSGQRISLPWLVTLVAAMVALF